MKLLWICLLCGFCLLFGIVLGRRATDSSAIVLPNQAASESLPVLEGNQTPTQALSERDHWKEQAEIFRKDAREVHKLRGEVTQLKAELVALEKQESSSGNRAGSSPTNVSSKFPAPERTFLGFDNVPSAIQSAILRETGGPAVNPIHVSNEKGRTVYGLKGKTGDDRSFALRLDEEGTVLERHLQIPAESIPPEIEKVVQGAFSDLVINNAMHVTEGDQQFYDLTAKAAEEGVHIRVRSDGVLLGYSAKMQPPEARSKK